MLSDTKSITVEMRIWQDSKHPNRIRMAWKGEKTISWVTDDEGSKKEVSS